MSTDPQPHKQSLTVLPSSGRVEQLRREMAENPPTSTASPAPLPRTATDPANAPSTNTNIPPELRLLEGKVIAAIRQVFDPEIPVNIYELGLIYAVDVQPDHTVNVKMTLTTPACPVAGSLPGEVQRRIEAIDEVKSANIDLVWDPPWDRSMMSEAAMLQLGMF
jgi:FeS assembly SUF system protein